MPAVLILGARAPVALDHARRFARQGWRVCVADSISCRGSAWSNAVTASVHIPSPRTEPIAFSKALARAVSRHRIDLLLPTCEEVFYVSRYRSVLPAHLRVAADEFEKLRALHSKLEFLTLAAGCGVHVPESCGVSNLGEARQWANGRPLVLKPEFSRFGVYVRMYPRGIPPQAEDLTEQGRWVAQELCVGEELCSYSVAVSGRLTAHVTYKPLYRLSRSSSYYFDTVHAPSIRAFVERFVQKLQFTGQISFDWIQHPNGEYSVLECNPRAISGVHLFALTDALPAALTGDASGIVEPSRQQARMISMVMATAGLVTAVRTGRVSQWWSNYRLAQDVIVHERDWRPLWGSLWDFGSHAARASQLRCSLRAAATRDIEWDGEGLPEC